MTTFFVFARGDGKIIIGKVIHSPTPFTEKVHG